MATSVGATGLLAALGLAGGAGTAAAQSDPTGLVGTDDRPVETVHVAALDGQLTGTQRVDSLAGDGISVVDGALTRASRIATVSVTPFEVADTVNVGQFPVEVEIAETADVVTDGLGVTLAVEDADGTTEYEATIDTEELQNQATTVTFGADDGTAALGPFDVGEYSATVTVDATNAEPATATDSFAVQRAFAGGSGESDDPYRIETWEHLDNVRDYSGSFELVTDLDETTTGYDEVASASADGGAGFDPIGAEDDAFSGTFDGNGHAITGLTIDRPDETDVGLFGITGSAARITDLRLESVTVNSYTNVGGLVGKNAGTVKRSVVTGEVEAGGTVGGLVGENNGTVGRSVSTVSVTGYDDFGGLVGWNDGTVSWSYATGPVHKQADDAGPMAGLVGYNDGMVGRSYAAGTLAPVHRDADGGLVGSNSGTVTDGYWDADSTGEGISAGSPDENGLTTAEMQGGEAADNLVDFEFRDVWATVDAETDADVSTDDYPVLQALDREFQLEVRE